MKSILQLIIIFTITYFLFAFMKADLNIINWGKEVRVFCCICVVILFVIYKSIEND